MHKDSGSQRKTAHPPGRMTQALGSGPWSSVLTGRTNSEYSWATWLIFTSQSLVRSKTAIFSSSAYDIFHFSKVLQC